MTHFRRSCLALSLLFMIGTDAATAVRRRPARRPTPPPVRTDFAVEEIANVTFAEVAGREVKLNIARPVGATHRTPVVLIALLDASRAEVFSGLAAWFAQRGYLGAVVRYRRPDEARFPAAIEDLKAAVRFFRTNPDQYGIDPDRIAALGLRMSGSLVALLATADESAWSNSGGSYGVSSRIQAAIDVEGPGDLLAYRASCPGAAQLGCEPPDCAEMWREASAVNHVSADDAPMLLIGSVNRTHALCAVGPVEDFHRRLVEAGVPASYWEGPLDQAKANTPALFSDPHRQRLGDFLDSTLRIPRAAGGANELRSLE